MVQYHFNVVDLGRSTLDGMGYEEYSLHADNVDQIYDRQTLFSNKLNEDYEYG